MTPRESFQGFLGDFSAEEFLYGIYGKKPLYLPGQPERFAHLLPWSEFDRILAQHRLESPRLRTVREGGPPPKEDFILQLPAKTGNVLRINLGVLNRQLQDGMMLVLDAVEEMYEPITQLCRTLEYILCDMIQVNAYAGWHSQQGFNTHWDNHEVFIVQVAGRKHWRMFEPQRRHPVTEDRALDLKPPEQSYWEGELKAGDLLYMPRGWWHDAVPLGEPTLHLTVSIKRPNGLQLLGSLIEQLREYEVVRADLPRMESADARRQYLSTFRDAVLHTLDGFSFDPYFQKMDAAAPARARLSLPLNAMPQSGGIAQSQWIHWLPPRPVTLEQVSDKVQFQVCNTVFKFEKVSTPVLQMLVEYRCLRFDKLCAQLPQVASVALESFLIKLLSVGLVALADREAI